MPGRDFLGEARRSLGEVLRAAAREVAGEFGHSLPEIPPFVVAPPRDPAHGDLSTNLALLLATPLGLPPWTVAEVLVRRLRLPPFPPVEKVEVAGPGFLNFRLRPGWLGPLVAEILASPEDYGRSGVGGGKKVQIEFVSANPTGPLNVVNARAAAYGDSLARVMEWAGYRVSREYYVNDAGRQFELLGLSLECRARELLGEEVAFPEEGYPGEYLIPLARRFLEERPGAREILRSGGEEERLSLRREMARFAAEALVSEQRETLRAYGVEYDSWVRESEIRASGGPEEVLSLLKPHLYEKEGAVFFRSSAWGDDQDRVLVRRDGEYTYFLTDIAYHLHKYRRGFELLLVIWGQDHHGYVPRLRAALQALGFSPSTFEVLLAQMVRLVRGGEAVRMSKRRGEYVTMAEFLEEAGRDAARFFFLTRSLDSHLDFDLDLARSQAEENPVYYVQYAHARIASIERQAEERGVRMPPLEAVRWELLREEPEEALLRLLAAFPGEVARAAEGRQPHLLTGYARELASSFHDFYTRCRVLGSPSNVKTRRCRFIYVGWARRPRWRRRDWAFAGRCGWCWPGRFICSGSRPRRGCRWPGGRRCCWWGGRIPPPRPDWGLTCGWPPAWGCTPFSAPPR